MRLHELTSNLNESTENLRHELLSKYDLESLWLTDYASRNAIEITSIVVGKNNQHNGIGTNVMNDIIDYADKHNKILVLSPALEDRRGKGTTSRSRLVKFYKRFGFVENKGRHKNYEFREAMIRYPKK